VAALIGTRPAITGERVMTSAGGFNPSWQRHVAAYTECAALLPPGKVLDLGCGIGHSYELLAPRETVGVDIDPRALVDQDRETHVADMRELPFASDCFASVVSVHSLEHIPDPERALAEVVRVLQPGGTALFVTPNRMTFGKPDEIIDPYHYVEYDAVQLQAVLDPWFESVDVRGLYGSERMLAFVEYEHGRLEVLLARDPLRLRRLLPRRTRQRLYDWKLARERRDGDPVAAEILPEDFWVGEGTLALSLDLVGVCQV
jgi:SAM-dependent methyltransferase